MRLARSPRRNLPWHLLRVGNSPLYRPITRHDRFSSSASTTSPITSNGQSPTTKPDNDNPFVPADQVYEDNARPPHDPSNPSSSIPLRRVATTTPPKLRNIHPEPANPPTPSTSLQNELTTLAAKFPRWANLARDSSLLAKESNFALAYPDRLVDQPQHATDTELWACILNFRHRVKGDEGVLDLWPELWPRRTHFRDIQDPYFQMMWQAMLDAALNTKAADLYLQNMTKYVEQTQARQPDGSIWHGFYTTIITYFLRRCYYRQALRWHLRLAPQIPPTDDDFIALLRRFCTDRKPQMVNTLQTLYILGPRRQVYDHIVPYLYSVGDAQLAVQWRQMLVRRDDVPQRAIPARPFLRYVKSYYPNEVLHPREEEAIEFSESEDEGGPQISPENSAEFVNLVHGETFGINAKNYNDTLGARWFASNWVSLDSAISTVATLGIEEIGPLSFQSIALREESSVGVLKRLDQLSNHHISVVDSAYTRIVTRFARLKDDELLFNLLRSDIHPDVWENLELQEQILESTAAAGDWPTHLLVLAARVVALEQSARDVANSLLAINIEGGRQRHQTTLDILNDMRALNIGLNYDEVNLLFNSLYKRVSVHKFNSESKDLATTAHYTALCLRLVSMGVPVPTWAWKQLLQSFGRRGNIDEMEKLCLNIIDSYTKSQPSRPGFVLIDISDAPTSMQRPLRGVEKIMGVYIPDNTPPETEWHPLRAIFDRRMTSGIVRWSFQAEMKSPLSKPVTTLTIRKPQAPIGYHCWRGLRLLRMMKDRGVRMRPKHAAQGVMLRFLELYGPEDIITKESIRQMRMHNTASLSWMKQLAELAWAQDGAVESGRSSNGVGGKFLLQSVEAIEESIEKTARKHRKKLNQMAAAQMSAEVDEDDDRMI